jgi:hypothetical protein
MTSKHAAVIGEDNGVADDFDSPSPVGQVRIGCSTCRIWGFSPRELVKHVLQAREEHSPRAQA